MSPPTRSSRSRFLLTAVAVTTTAALQACEGDDGPSEHCMGDYACDLQSCSANAGASGSGGAGGAGGTSASGGHDAGVADADDGGG